MYYFYFFVLEFDYYCVICRVLAFYYVWVDLGRDYYRIFLILERVLIEYKVGYGRGEVFS